MKITLKMKIDDQDFDLVVDMTMNAGRIYRQQFQSDLIQDLSEIYQKTNLNIFDKIDFTKIDTEGKTEEEVKQQIIEKAYPIWSEAQKNNTLSFTDTERATQIIWAFVKNADKDLPGYEEWVDGFDFILPIKEIITALYNAWNESAKPTVEIKN